MGLLSHVDTANEPPRTSVPGVRGGSVSQAPYSGLASAWTVGSADFVSDSCTVWPGCRVTFHQPARYTAAAVRTVSTAPLTFVGTSAYACHSDSRYSAMLTTAAAVADAP